MKEYIETIQEEAIRFIHRAFMIFLNPICALDMGFGKTRVACHIIQEITKENKNYRILIVLKASNYKNPWIEELLMMNVISVQINTVLPKPNLPFLRQAYKVVQSLAA
jgi:hypothetical protein